MKGKERLMEQTGNLDLLFSLQIILQVLCLEYKFVISGCCRVEKVYLCCSCIHCSIRFGNSETSSVARRKMSDEVKGNRKSEPPAARIRMREWVWSKKGELYKAELNKLPSPSNFCLCLILSQVLMLFLKKEKRDSRWLKLLIINLSLAGFLSP